MQPGSYRGQRMVVRAEQAPDLAPALRAVIGHPLSLSRAVPVFRDDDGTLPSPCDHGRVEPHEPHGVRLVEFGDSLS